MKYFILFSMLTAVTLLNAQSIRGAEFQFTAVSKSVIASLTHWSKNGELKDSILIDWGDDESSYIHLVVDTQWPEGVVETLYRGLHEYQEDGYYKVTYNDSFLVANIANIPASASASIELSDTIGVFSDNFMLSDWSSPMLGSRQNQISFENGQIVHEILSLPISIFEYKLGELIPFPTDFEVLEMDNAEVFAAQTFRWEPPDSAGTYAFAIKVSLYRDFIIEPGVLDTALLATATRAFMIDVTEDMIVNTQFLQLIGDLNLYPNPTTSQVQLDCLGCEDMESMEVRSVAGQLVYQSSLKAGTARFQHSIDVSTWPAGLYLVELLSESGRVVRKLVVE